MRYRLFTLALLTILTSCSGSGRSDTDPSVPEGALFDFLSLEKWYDDGGIDSSYSLTANNIETNLSRFLLSLEPVYFASTLHSQDGFYSSSEYYMPLYFLPTSLIKKTNYGHRKSCDVGSISISKNDDFGDRVTFDGCEIGMMSLRGHVDYESYFSQGEEYVRASLSNLVVAFGSLEISYAGHSFINQWGEMFITHLRVKAPSLNEEYSFRRFTTSYRFANAGEFSVMDQGSLFLDRGEGSGGIKFYGANGISADAQYAHDTSSGNLDIFVYHHDELVEKIKTDFSEVQLILLRAN